MPETPPARSPSARLLLARALHLTDAMLLAAMAYRLRLAWLAASELRSAGVAQPWDAGPTLAFRPAGGDVLLAWLAGLVLLAWLAAIDKLPDSLARVLRGGVTGTAGVLLLALGMLSATHLRLVFSLHSGLTLDLLRDTLASGEWRALFEHAHAVDVATVLVGPLAWLGSRRVSLRASLRWAVALAILLSAGALLPPVNAGELPSEAGATPLWFTLQDVWLHARPAPDEAMPRERQPLRAAPALQTLLDPAHPATQTADPLAGEPALFLEDPRISDPPSAEKIQPPAKKPWNVVWIVMESTGMRYFQGETYRGILPMPFTHKLADQGWFLRHHRSPSNSSATSLFAQFSGVYPVPALKMFSTDKRNHVPALFSFLPRTYERFLYTPGKLTYFFPKAFLQHAGLSELVGFDESTVTKNPGGEGLSKDEPAVVDTFVQRLHRAKEPFAAVYYSYVAHWEYTDYGPAWRHFRDPRLIGRYHDNLWLLDQMIKRIYDGLERDGRLDRTIVVLAGDHGESFGQHDRNWAHARGSYEENLATPAILWQPRVFPAKTVDWDTLHIDLLPTVLDALGLPYDARLLQGESLFQTKLRRKVAFFWGNEGTVSGLWADGGKLQWQPTDKHCVAFDLGTDPQERRPKRCASERLELLRAWRDFQREVVPAYSEAVRQGQAYRGRRQPLPASLPDAQK